MSDEKKIPASWLIADDFDPQKHMMNLKGQDYLNVQNRLLWFIKDQRDFIMRGLATTSYVIRTELVEQDREAGYAHFKTYVRDVLGNEATMYGSEAVKDFGDYAEKASTKSLGRALLALGYGTAFASEMDEGDRVVDSPVERQMLQQRMGPDGNAAGPIMSVPATQRAFVAAPKPLMAAPDPIMRVRASAEEQRRLVEALREAGHDTTRKVFIMLTAILGRARVVNVTDLLACESDLTVAEVAKLHAELTAVAGSVAGKRG